MHYLSFYFLLFTILWWTSCGQVNPPKKPAAAMTAEGLPLDSLQLPKGFSISLFASELTNARSMDYAPTGTLYVGTRSEGKVYALRDTDGDHKADQTYILAEGLNMPNGVAYKDGDLYVAEVHRVIRYRDIENHLSSPPKPEIVRADYPTETHHGWKYIAFGPDEKLYVPVGAPCNICESENEIFATITRLDIITGDREIVQHGIRNTVGFDWHPETKDLWFTDNGRDWLGDDMPACELNHATQEGLHFGYPYCHQGDLPDPEFGHLGDCSEFVAPAQKMGAHVAPLGMEFYHGNMFPEKYRHQPFIAEHGSWNRSDKSGYVVSLVTLDDQGVAIDYQPFISGWLDKQTDDVWGRPVDIEMMPDGSLLISDDFADAIYRVTYKQ